MNIKVKTPEDEFYCYGIEFIPTNGDLIIKDDKVYKVKYRVWNEDTSETIVQAAFDRYDYSNCSEQDVIELIDQKQYLKAIKMYKETFNATLIEAKDWVDAHSR